MFFPPPKIKVEMSPQRTHSPWLTDEDAEPGVSADPRGREIPGGELGSYSGLPARHLFPPEAAAIPLLPDVTGGAPAPVALLFLPIQPLRFRRAWTSCSCRGRGAGGRSSRRLWIRVCAEALKIYQLCFLLIGELKLSERLLRAGVRCRLGDLFCGGWRRMFFWSGGVENVECARLCCWRRGLRAGCCLPREAGLGDRKGYLELPRLLLSGCCYFSFRWGICERFWWIWF